MEGDYRLLVEAEHTLGHLLLLNRGLCVRKGSGYLGPVVVNWPLCTKCVGYSLYYIWK